ncbi:MAG: DUF3857 domain-containing protein [Deltaproteobacteria bacterium]|nr:DUF3857 domain-containing protein [Deltaproteobacteria bacterium]
MTTQITDAPADARVLERAIHIDIAADGRTTRSERRVVEFLTDFAQEVYADPAVVFDSSSQRLTIDVARTTEPDGTIQDTPSIGINELSLPDLIGAPAFASIRETVVTHVGIQPGAKAELAWTLEDTAPPPGGIAGGEVALHWAIPIERFELRVTVPSGSELQHECHGCPLVPAISDGAGTRTYLWQASDLEPLDWFESSAHVGGPEDGLDGPRIVFSTAASWDEAMAPLRAAVVPGTAGRDAGLAGRPVVAGVLDDLPSLAQQVEALQAFVGEDLATVHVPRGLPFRPPARAGDTLDRSGGTPLEKAILLSGLLSGIGVSGSPALAAGPAEAADVPLLGAFPDAFVTAVVDGTEYWLPVDRRGMWPAGHGFGGRTILRTDPSGGPATVALADGGANQAAMTVEATLHEDGAVSAHVSLTLTGGQNPYADLRTNESDPSETLGDAAAALLPSGEAGDVVLEAFGSDRTSATVAVLGQLDQEAPGTLTLPLPWPGDDPFPPSLYRSSRDTPLDLEQPFARTISWVVKLPDGWEARLVPPTISVTSSVGRFDQSVVVGDGEIRVERTLEITRARIEPTEYDGLLRIRRAFATSGSSPLVIAPAH